VVARGRPGGHLALLRLGLRHQEADDLCFLREAALALLREDELPVTAHVELALLTLDDRRVVAVCVQRGRETRGPRVVAVSDGAVVDLDAHVRDRTRQIVLNCSNGCRQLSQ